MTNYYRSGKGSIAIGKQTGKGSPLAAGSCDYLRFESEAMANNQDVANIRAGGGDRDVVWNIRRGYAFDGEFVVFAQPNIAGLLTYLVLGNDSTALAVASGAQTGFQHRLTPIATGELPYATIYREVNDQIYDRVSDAKGNALTIEGVAGDPIKLTYAYIGIDNVQQVTPLSEVLDATRPLVMTNTDIYLNGSLISSCKSFTVTISNNCADDVYTTDIVREDIISGNLDIEVEAVLLFDSHDMYRNVLYGADATKVGDVEDIYTGSFEIWAKLSGDSTAQSYRLFIPHLDFIGLEGPNLAPDNAPMEFTLKGMAKKVSGTDKIIIDAYNSKDAQYDA